MNRQRAVVTLAATAAALLLATPATALSPQEAARARLHYLQHCMGCHLADGRGAPEQGVPSMRGLAGRLLTLPGGREYLVQVPGGIVSATFVPGPDGAEHVVLAGPAEIVARGVFA